MVSWRLRKKEVPLKEYNEKKWMRSEEGVAGELLEKSGLTFQKREKRARDRSRWKIKDI